MNNVRYSVIRLDSCSNVFRAPRLAALFVAAAALLSGCIDRTAQLTAPREAEAPTPDAALTVLLCTGTAVALSCEPASAPSAQRRGELEGRPLFDRVLGGQNTYVKLSAVSNSFDSGLKRLSSVVSVKNLTDQPLGTTDGPTLDADGVRIFFHTLPTNGVTIINADGVGNFTASNQPFFKYNEIIPGNATNLTAKTWVFQLPTASTTFTFQVYVTANQPNESEPLVVPARTFASLSSGGSGNHTCAVRSGGASYCWGRGDFGQLANGVHGHRDAPTGVADTTEFVSLVRGGYSTCGLTAAGIAYCWGDNDYGQLGDGTTTDRFVPTRVAISLGVTFTSLAAGLYHTCALTNTRIAYCWGRNNHGQVGDNTIIDRSAPVAVGTYQFSSLTAGSFHTCASVTGNGPLCWGLNANGQIGDNSTTDRRVPTRVQLGDASSVSAGGSHTCAISNGQVWCWGSNTYGQLGTGDITQRNAPTWIAGSIRGFTSLALGLRHSCGLVTNSTGSVYCWGSNDVGQIGQGSAQGFYVAATLVWAGAAGLTDAAAVAAGDRHNCALGKDGRAFCWGSNDYGQLGDGTLVDRRAPTAVQMP